MNIYILFIGYRPAQKSHSASVLQLYINTKSDYAV